MAVIYIRDVSEEELRGFKSAAALAGKSLPRWALERLRPGGKDVEVQAVRAGGKDGYNSSRTGGNVGEGISEREDYGSGGGGEKVRGERADGAGVGD